jgi:hypothetical protein
VPTRSPKDPTVRRAPLLLAATLLLAACGDEVGTSDPIALEDGSDTGAATDGAEDGTEDGAAEDDGEPEGDGGAAEPAPDGPEAEAPLADVVDASVAEPGTWQVGGAGTVTFSIADGRLALDEVAPADGWRVTEQAADEDSIDVDLERDGERSTFEVDLKKKGTELEVRIDHDTEDAEPGSFELGDAASLTVSVDGDRLVLDDLAVGSGWEVGKEKVGDDEVELELVRGDQRWDLEIELDDGRLVVERVYEVRGSV